MTALLDSVYEEEIRIWVRPPSGGMAEKPVKAMTSGRGLAVHPGYSDWEGKTPLASFVGVWVVSHVGSGHALPVQFPTMDAALAFMAKIDSLIDWTQTMWDIQKIGSTLSKPVTEACLSVGGSVA